jgi:hypothetical protein
MHIRAMRADAATAMATATDATMQEQVGVAVHDLDEAASNITTATKATDDSALAIADLAIVLAATRLTKIDLSLERDGPDARVKDEI